MESRTLFAFIYVFNNSLRVSGDLLAFIWYASLCALSLPGMVNFYTELMKGLGASARLFELRNRVPAVPVSGSVIHEGFHSNFLK